MFLEMTALSFVVAWLRGGRLKADFGLKQMWLAPVAYLLQVVNYLVVPPVLNIPVTALSYLLLFYFAWLNLENQGVRLILIGMLLNAVVIAANGGRLPVDIDTGSRIGVDVQELVGSVSAKHAPLNDQSRLKFLGDVVPVPFPKPRMISVGDIFALMGTFFLVQDLMGKTIVLMKSEEPGK
ncbi:MAG TPA: DUF5317 domain-containing protein [Symbiobacteriaceae bacterium]|jgi:hypothetical protein